MQFETVSSGKSPTTALFQAFKIKLEFAAVRPRLGWGVERRTDGFTKEGFDRWDTLI